MRSNLHLVTDPPEPPEARLLADMRERERVKARLASLDQRIAAGVRAYSYARGYCVPIRAEQVRRELEA